MCLKDYRNTQKSLTILTDINLANRVMCIHYSCATIDTFYTNNADQFECENCWKKSDLEDFSKFEGWIGYDYYSLVGTATSDVFQKHEKTNLCEIWCNAPYFWSGRVSYWTELHHRDYLHTKRCFSSWCKESSAVNP